MKKEMTTIELAAIMGVSPGTARHSWRRWGIEPTRRIGASQMLSVAGVLAAIRRMATERGRIGRPSIVDPVRAGQMLARWKKGERIKLR